MDSVLAVPLAGPLCTFKSLCVVSTVADSESSNLVNDFVVTSVIVSTIKRTGSALSLVLADRLCLCAVSGEKET